MGIAIPMLDLMFFLTENQENPRHVGAVLIFERPARGGARLAQRVAAAYRRARPVPPFNRVPELFRAGRPEWREVERLDMGWHVQQRTLPPPGSDAQLHALVAELHAPVLERDRPGWQVFVIDGLERNRFALFIKVHHALVDGESGIELVHRSLSRSARDRRIRTLVETRLPPPRRSAERELLPWLRHEAENAARGALAVALGSNRLIGETLAGLRGFSPDETRPFTAPLTPLNEPIRGGRSIAHTMLPLPELKAVARARGGTLNDVVLCVLDAAMNRYLRGLGRAPARPLVAICPVSLQDPEARQATTRVSMFWTPLGSPRATLERRAREVIANTRAAKSRTRAMPRDAAYAYAVLTFAMGEVLALVPRGSLDYFLPSNVLISNVRGPDEPLYLGGARLEALCPLSTLISGMGLNVTFMSYAGKLVVGFTANASALPDAGRLAQYTSEAFTALARRIGAKRSPARSRSRAAHRGRQAA
jgi:WS/DGAT/MGAT family acyltransferase